MRLREEIFIFVNILSLTKKGFFAVNTLTGVVKYFSKNNQGGNRGTVRRNRNNNTIPPSLRGGDYN